MRLGFAVAINVDPDVLLVDEVLAVGDEAFTHKCLDKFAEFRRRGRTIVLVTHTLDLVTRFCDEALWLDGGRVRAQGDPKRVVDAYLLEVAGAENQAGRRPAARAAGREPGSATAPGRWGSKDAEIEQVELLRAGRPAVRMSSSRAADAHPRARARAAAAARLRLRHRHLQRRRRVLLRHEHRHRGRRAARALGSRRVHRGHRSAGSGGRHLQARRGGASRRTACRTTTTGCSTRSASPRR